MRHAPFSRRTFLLHAAGLVGAVAWGSRLGYAAPGGSSPQRRMVISLNWGSIGVQANQREAIELARKHGFEAVSADAQYLARMDEAARRDLPDQLKAKNLQWGAAGLPVEFRQDETRFSDSLKAFQPTAAALRQAGVARISTWLSPGHGTLSYKDNFRQHASRLRQVARVLQEEGLRLGLEYVGTRTARGRQPFPFIYSMAGMKELIAEMDTGNVGVVLDSWHWWQAGETAQDIVTLKNEQVVAVDLNDAPAGIPIEEQRDNQRELPGATGVIDLDAFLGALNRIGYSGPIRAEPFNRRVNELDNDAACAATIQAMRKVVGMNRA